MDSPYIGRIVVLLTPVLASLAGWLAQLAAEYLPGAPDLDETGLTVVFVAGAGAVVAAIWKWLENRGKFEQAQEFEPAVPARLVRRDPETGRFEK